MGEAEKAPKQRLHWYQYRLAHLFVLMTLVAIGCSVYVWKVRKARRQKLAVEAIEKLGGRVWYDYQTKDDDYFSYISGAEPPGPKWLRELVGLDCFADVAHVHFCHTRATNANLIHLKDLTELKLLDLSGNALVGDAGLKQLGTLKQLELLNLASTQTTDAGPKILNGLTNLKWLGLAGTQVGDAGLKDLRGLTELELLNLEFTQITDAGLENLEPLANLKRLHLRNTQVSDAGLKHLRGLSKLEWLSLNHTQVTYDGVKRLQEALPNCHIGY